MSSPSPVLANARTDAQLAQILALQRRNLRGALDAETEARQGFVYAEHSMPVLRTMAASMPQAIALAGGQVVGYSLAMAPDMRGLLPTLAPMFAQFDQLTWRGGRLADTDYVVGGQVCVDAGWRGQGLIGQLYAHTRLHVPVSVRCCVTEIALRNGVSLRAHARIGFVPIAQYRDSVEEWVVVLQDFGR